MESGVLIAENSKLDYKQLALVPCPPGTTTHKPIPHHEVVDAVVESLGFRHIGVHNMEFAVSKDGNKMFGLMELETTFNGCRVALGLRNSHDKTMRLAVTVGYRVFVCQNMAFHGDFTPLLAKHSKHFQLIPSIAGGIDLMQRDFEPMVKSVETWQATHLSDVAVKLLIYEAFIERSDGSAAPFGPASP
jgi:hypothetical protein